MSTVVVVDDEPLEREAIKYILKQERPQLKMVGGAGSGRAGVELIKELRPDIVFMDIKMPGVGGIEAIHAVREVSSTTEVVVLTAYDEFDFAHEALKLGARDYLLKPARPEEIIAIVDDICQEKASKAARLQEEQELRQQLSDVMPLIAMGLVLDLCFGRTENIAQIQERAAFLNLGAEPYRVLLVDIDNFAASTDKQPEVQRQLLKKQVLNVLQRTVQQREQSLVIPFGSDSFLVLVSQSKEEEAGILADNLCQEVDRWTDCTVTVAVGYSCSDLSQIHLSYKSAEKACSYGSFFGANHVVYASEMSQGNNYDLAAYPFNLEARIMEKVELGEGQAAQELLNQLWPQLVLAGAGEERLIRWKAMELVVGLGRAALKGGAEPGKLVTLQRTLLEDITGIPDVKGIRRWVEEVLSQCLQVVWQGQMAVQTQAIVQAKKYMAKHFRRPILLEDVAAEVHLSPCYFSRLFKESEGINFIDYLTKLRIEEGKRLLLQTTDTIAVIAETIGYGEANYFSRLFRRQVGVSPSHYRQKSLAE